MSVNQLWRILNKNTIIAFLSIIFLCSSCTYQHKYPTVLTSWILPYEINTHDTIAYQSYNGNHLILGDLSYIDTKTGTISHPLDAFLPQDWTNLHFVDQLLWSDQGNILIIQTHGIDSSLSENQEIVYTIDLQQKILSEGFDIGTIFVSSPFGERIIANPLHFSNIWPQVYDLVTKQQVPLSQASSPNIDKIETAGSNFYLWEQATNLPIAKVNLIDPINFAGKTNTQQIGYSPLTGGMSGEIKEDTIKLFTVFESQPPDNVVDVIFDPSGDYLVLTKWECDPNDPQQCTQYPDAYYTDSVTDTVILLVNWRTGEEHELFRLSDIDSDHPIGSYTTWSMDGSTLLLWRQDAPPVVLKIKYPNQ